MYRKRLIPIHIYKTYIEKENNYDRSTKRYFDCDIGITAKH